MKTRALTAGACVVFLSTVACAVGNPSPGSTSPDAGPTPEPDGGFEPRFASFVYVGSGDGNIYRFRLDEAAGTLSEQQAFPGGSNPSFLAFSPDKRYLFAVSEGTTGLVRAFSIDGTTGAVTPLNSIPSKGAGPTHLSLDGSGKWLLVANYTAGTVAVLPVGSDGRLSPSVDDEAPGVKAHQILADPSNRFVFVPALGSDQVAQYRFDAQSGALAPNTPASVATAGGAGPRHLAFHPGGTRAFLINELDSTLTSFQIDAEGRLTPIQTVGTLEAGVTQSTGAEVQVHPAGHTVYVSNRLSSGTGVGDIASYRVGADGRLTLLAHTPTGGETPRHFSLDASGTLLLVANQTTGNVVAMRVNAETGALTSLGEVASGLGSPTFVQVLRLPLP